MKILPCLALFSLAILPREACAGAPGASPSAIQYAIGIVLKELHPTDTPSWWRSLGPDAPGVMISMYDSESYIYHRLRLVQALGYFESPEVDAFLKEQAAGSQDDVIRDAAITSIGLSEGAAEEDFIAQFLQSDDPQARLAAALALKRIGDPKSQGYLDRFYKSEKIAWVKDKVLQAPVSAAQPPLEIAKQDERKLDPSFEGSWSGYWIEPDPDPAGSGNGLISVEVSAILKPEGASGLSGELKVKTKGTVFHMGSVTGKDGRITGILWTLASKVAVAAPGSSPAPSPSPNAEKVRAEFAFRGELLKKKGALVLRLDLPQTLGTVVARKAGH